MDTAYHYCTSDISILTIIPPCQITPLTLDNVIIDDITVLLLHMIISPLRHLYQPQLTNSYLAQVKPSQSNKQSKYRNKLPVGKETGYT